MTKDIHPKEGRTTIQRNRFTTFWLRENNYLKDNHHSVGGISWSKRGETVGSLTFEVDTKMDRINESYIRLIHSSNENQVEINKDYLCFLRHIPCFFGGKRWFFECRGFENEGYCGKRVCILYRSKDSFVCRKCANISYESCNENKLYRNNPFKIILQVNKADKIKTDMKKTNYKGKPTKKHLRATRLIGSITNEDVKNAEESLWNQ